MNKLQRKKPDWLMSTRYFSAENQTILFERAQDSMKISHLIPTEGLVKINSNHIKVMKGHRAEYALKALYNSCFGMV